MKEITVGLFAECQRTFTDADVRQFAQVTGDTNPVHLDEAFAAETRFGRRVVHGMLLAGVISALLGTRLPGRGAIYLSQTLAFRAPVFIGDTVTVRVEVTAVRPDKPIVTLRTVCTSEAGVTVLEGEAVLLAAT